MTSPFRQSALKRLASPEELDRTLSVTTPKGWIAVVALTAVVAAVIVWSFEGEVSSYVPSQGILVNHGGTIVDAVATGSGTLTRILPAPGDAVEAGEVVAETANFETAERFRSARALVDERATAVAELREAIAAENALVEENVVRQRERLEQLERSARESVETAQTRLEDHLRLFDERVITRVTVERSQQAVDRTQRELFDTLRQRDDLEATDIRRRNEQRVRLAEAEARLQAAERAANEMAALVDTQRIMAPVSGIVTEVKAAIGAVLGPGQPVASIETGAEQLEMLMYLPATEGKKVEEGMEVLVSPSTTRREEYGSVRGVVEYVSEFPSSLESIVATLQNPALAQRVSASGAPYAGRVALVRDPSTASGFAWTSPKASNETLEAGTLATAEVRTGARAPITLAVPLIKEALGL